eukprot:scaffold13913_cov84-Skeletonema_dohrnii-CCMP3373.AAC.3
MAEDFIYMGEPNPIVPRGATRVIVDESVRVIPAEAFEGNGHIVELICRDGVEKVERWAFAGCRSLRHVIMPGVEVVEQFAFGSCVAMTDVECGKLERIERYSFSDCKSLRSINLPSAKIVEEWAFADCTAITNVEFGKELESIGERVFCNCTSLEQITIPLKDGVFDHDNIFHGCEKLERVDLVGGEIQQVNIAIAAFLMEKWRKDMNEAIDSINQILPDTPAGADRGTMGKKSFAIRKWISNVLRKFAHYQKQHRRLVKEAMTTVELAMWKKSLNERDNVPERVEEGGRANRRITCGVDGAKATGPSASSAAAAAATSITSSGTTAAAWEKRKASSENTESDPTRAECRVKCGADIVIKNVRPFLELPPYTFDRVESFHEEDDDTSTFDLDEEESMMKKEKGRVLEGKFRTTTGRCPGQTS